MSVVVHRSDEGDLLGLVRQFGELAREWHRSAHHAVRAAGPVTSAALVLHASNFDLWHQEDAARRPGADDCEVGCRKRCIDQLNDRRNVAIEDIDVGLLPLRGRHDGPVRLHTETPGRIIDRLSVLSLRMWHARRAWHHDPRVAVFEEQFEDLCAGLDWFLDAIRSGEVGFKLYRQYKSDGQRGYCDLFEPQLADQLTPVNRRCGWCRPDVCKLTAD